MKVLRNYSRYIFWLSLAMLIVISALFRFPLLSQFPPSMLPDEAALGYNALSIAETGRDEWGTSWPLIFQSFGDDKPPAFIYATAFVYLFTGWTPTLPRLTSAIAGVLIVVVLTLWLRKITKSDSAALLGGLIAAVSPWTVHLSRSALESNLGLLFFTCGLLGLAFTKKIAPKIQMYLIIFLTSLSFILSAYSFHSYRLATPLYLGTLLLIAFYSLWKHHKFRTVVTEPLFIICAITCMGILPGIIMGGSTTRFSQTSLLKPVVISDTISVHRDTCHEMSTQLHLQYVSRICQFVWNPYSVSTIILYRSFIDHLVPTFIFITGDPGFARNPTQTGLLFVFLLPFFVFGLYLAIRSYKLYHYLLVGYLVAIVPSALTGPTHSTRLSPLIPFVIALCVIGVLRVSKRFSFIFWPITAGLLIAGTLFMLQYSEVTYGRSQDFVGHSKELSQLIYQYAQNDQLVFVDPLTLPEPHIYLAFWNQIPPTLFQNLEKNSAKDQLGFRHPRQLGSNIYFEEPSFNKLVCDRTITKNILFISSRKLDAEPDRVIKNNTNVHTVAFVYELDSIRSNSSLLQSMCGE